MEFGGARDTPGSIQAALAEIPPFLSTVTACTARKCTDLVGRRAELPSKRGSWHPAPGAPRVPSPGHRNTWDLCPRPAGPSLLRLPSPSPATGTLSATAGGGLTFCSANP